MSSPNSRMLLGLSASGFSSLTNFVAVLWAAREYTDTGFASYSIAYFAAQTLMFFLRGTLGESYLASSASERLGGRRNALFTFFCISGVVAWAGVPFTEFRPAQLLLIFTPILLAQESARISLFGEDNQFRVVLLDVIWLLIVIASIVLRVDPAAGWVAGAGVSVVAAFALGHFGLSVTTFRYRWDGISSILREVLAFRMSSQIGFFLASFVGGPLAVSGLVAARTLLGPATVVREGANAVLLVRLRNRELPIGQIVKVAAIWIVPLISILLIVALALPQELYDRLLAEQSENALQVLPFVAATILIQSIDLAIQIGSRVTGQNDAIRTARLYVVLPYLVVPPILTWTFGAQGAAASFSLGAALGVFFLLRNLNWKGTQDG